MPKKVKPFCSYLSAVFYSILLVFFSLHSVAQQITITGKVTSSDNSPLAFASVQVKGQTTGTLTNEQGSFTISVQKSGTLIFNHVGYTEQQIIVGDQAFVNVVLQLADNSLDQVVVVAYGKQKKISVTGAIASIQTKEIKQSPAANLAVSLAGRLPGLVAAQRSGEPGRDVTQLFIRGQGTINNQSPIVLVDGVERELTFIDPNEVESVTILKDASSTAIFGVRGANGVILVTTRRGVSEIPEISFTAETGLQDFTRYINPVNSYEFATLRNQAQKNDGATNLSFSPDAIEKYRTGSDRLRYPNTDWRKILIKDFSMQQRYNLNISGAGKAVKYFVNAGYLNQGGQFNVEKGLNYDPSFSLKRFNFRSNIDIQLNRNLKAYLNLAGYLEKTNSPFSVFNVIGERNQSLENLSPSLFIIAFSNDLDATVPGPLTPDGQVITSATVPHPSFGQINRTGYIQQTRSNITATYGMEQNLDFITPGLSTKAVMSFDAKTTNNLFAERGYQKFVQVVDPNLHGVDGQDSVYFRPYNNDKNTPLALSGGRFFTTTSNFQAYLNYNRNFRLHNISALVLYQQQKTIINEQLPFNLIGLASRVTYGYDNRYFLEFNAGYNGSEQFAKGKRFGFFPAVSGGWVVSNEKFLKNNNILTSVKIRGSYGEVGNDRISGRRFLYLDNIQVVGGGYSSSLGNSQTINTILLRNELLQWEVAKKANIGLEVSFLKSFSLIVDLFKEKRDNILRNRGTVPVLNGLPNSALAPVNIGIVENKGFEIELNYRKRFNRDFSVFAKANMNYATNRQLFADEPFLPADYANRYRETGYRIGQPFGYLVDRYFTDTADISKSPVQNVGRRSSRPGDFKYKDLNNDGIINEKDQAPIGYSNVPEISYGGAFNITYKNLDLSVLFQGVSHVYNFYQGRGTYAGNNYVKRHLESWTPERVAAGLPINYPRLTLQPSPNEIANDFFIIDASYIRLKNIEIGYTLPVKFSNKITSKSIRFYANGLNLVTWDKLPTNNFDPELITDLAYPVTRLFNFGVNLIF